MNIFKRKPKWDGFIVVIGATDATMKIFALPAMTIRQAERAIKRRTCAIPARVTGMRRGMHWALRINKGSSNFIWKLSEK